MRRIAGQHLVQHAPQRIDVGSIGQVPLGGSLLGRHVVRRAQRQSCLRHAPAGGGTHRQGNTEVGHHRSPIVQQDVFGFDIAVNDIVPVGVVECVSDVDGDADGFFDTELRLTI